jgi:long-subunit acyl-CoA synthetase (AMP-forming)
MAASMKALIAYDGSTCADAALDDLMRAGLPGEVEAMVVTVAELWLPPPCLGFTILQGYSLSETAGAATVTRFEDNKVGSVGTPLGGVEVRIDQPDEEGIGEVLIRGPIVMPGYYRNPEARREAFTANGWFRSGDLGRFDRAGHLYIVGRKKDVIKLPTGKQIFPDDVEGTAGRGMERDS